MYSKWHNLYSKLPLPYFLRLVNSLNICLYFSSTAITSSACGVEQAIKHFFKDLH